MHNIYPYGILSRKILKILIIFIIFLDLENSISIIVGLNLSDIDQN